MNNDKLLMILDRLHDLHEVTDEDVQAGRIRLLVNSGLVNPNGHQIKRYGCILTEIGKHKRRELHTVAKWRASLGGRGWRPTA